MFGLIAILATVAGTHLPICDGYISNPTPAQRAMDAAAICAATRLPATSNVIGTVLAAGPWRVVWARPLGSEPGVFFFRNKGGKLHCVNTWGGVLSGPADRDEALRWAADKIAALATLA